MVKSFEEFISEGFWKSGINRAKSGDVRREEKYKKFYQDGVFPVEGYKGFFFQFEYLPGLSPVVYIYKTPVEDVLCTFFAVEKVKNNRYKYCITDKYSFNSYSLDNRPDREDVLKIAISDEFVDAVNKSMLNVPNKYFFKNYKTTSIDESFWKSGIQRASDNKTRIEDANPIDDVFQFFSTCIKKQFPNTTIKPRLEVENKKCFEITFSPFDGKDYFLNIGLGIKFDHVINFVFKEEITTRFIFTKVYMELHRFNENTRNHIDTTKSSIIDKDKLRSTLKKYQYIEDVFLDKIQKVRNIKDELKAREILLDTSDI